MWGGPLILLNLVHPVVAEGDRSAALLLARVGDASSLGVSKLLVALFRVAASKHLIKFGLSRASSLRPSIDEAGGNSWRVPRTWIVVNDLRRFLCVANLTRRGSYSSSARMNGVSNSE
ncbi:hypothetical protein FHS27_003820 [Rhodopirellula rubra]|uniref:Uncharacterized protein n=1 Tax=Aporhodopirellula rubra TaxID=980271 RepID=A0A7W5E0L7_9BACT|nr:hypothetical protein [Aporhodopirellula rubra]